MSGRVKILSVSRGFFRDSITVLALDDCSIVFDSLMGARKFYLKEGRRQRVSVGKQLYAEGETVQFDEVCTCTNAFSYSWCWAYG